jgi:hypothetical protein
MEYVVIVGYFEDIPCENTLRTIGINFIGVINGIHAALPLPSTARPPLRGARAGTFRLCPSSTSSRVSSTPPRRIRDLWSSRPDRRSSIDGGAVHGTFSHQIVEVRPHRSIVGFGRFARSRAEGKSPL